MLLATIITVVSCMSLHQTTHRHRKQTPQARRAPHAQQDAARTQAQRQGLNKLEPNSIHNSFSVCCKSEMRAL